MGTTKVSARWTGEALDFTGSDGRGNEIAIGGKNIRPTYMLLLGLAGCTGMDVVSILQKKRQQVSDVEVYISGHNADEYPKPYHTIEITFVVKGENLDPKAVERAIKLSTEKYCVVGQTLESEVDIKISFTIEA